VTIVRNFNAYLHEGRFKIRLAVYVDIWLLCRLMTIRLGQTLIPF